MHVFPSQSWGGAEIYMLELAEAQAAADRASGRGEVLLWVPAASRLDREARARGLTVVNDVCPHRFSFPALWQIPQVLRRERITHVVAHWSGAVWAFLGLKFSRQPIQFVLHIHMWISRAKKDLLHRFLYARLDRVIVAGRRAFDAALEKLPIPTEKLIVVPYAISQPASVVPRGEDQESRAVWGWSADDVIFGMFARLDKQKGQREFLHAARTLLDDTTLSAVDRARLRLVIVGDATAGEAAAEAYGAEIEQYIRTDPELAAITFRSPFRADFAELLKVCDVLVAPSYHESYALILLHAFALGVPVLATDSGGTPDLVTAASGWLVPPERVPELAKVMKAILLSSQLRREKSGGAQELVRTEHTFAAILTQYENALQSDRR